MFNSEKTTHVADFFLWKNGGNFTMPYLKLMKLMYFTEKEGLFRFGYSITGDNMVSMPHGPVLSCTYNMLQDGSPNNCWNKWISGEKDYCVALNAKGLTEENIIDKLDLLNRAERELISEIHDKYKNLTRWQIRDLTHDPSVCPEWNDPHESSSAITLDNLFLANGKADELEDVRQRLEEEGSFDFLSKGLL